MADLWGWNKGQTYCEILPALTMKSQTLHYLLTSVFTKICSWYLRYLSITSAQRSPCMMLAAARQDTPVCGPLLRQLWGSSQHKTVVPMISVSISMSVFPALLWESKHLAWKKAAHLSNLLPQKSTQTFSISAKVTASWTCKPLSSAEQGQEFMTRTV